MKCVDGVRMSWGGGGTFAFLGMTSNRYKNKTKKKQRFLKKNSKSLTTTRIRRARVRGVVGEGGLVE